MTAHDRRANSSRETRARSSWLLGFTSCAAWLAGGDALAGSFELAWTAPEECPKAAFVEGEVARVVGRPWSELRAEWRSARASVGLRDGGYLARVSVVTQAGIERTRSVIAASCTEAAEAAVAILAAGMSPAQTETTAPRDESREPPSGASGQSESSTTATVGAAAVSDAPSAVDSAPPGVLEEESAGTPAHLLIAAHVGVDIGSLAVVAPFAQLSGGLEWGLFSAMASASATGSVIADLDGGSAGAQMSLLLGAATACWRLTATNPSLAGCAGVELGSLAARGIGTIDSRSGRVLWSASVARAALDWNIGALSVVSVGATGVFPFRRLRVISSPEEAHRTPSVALRPWLGLGLRFE